MCWQATTDDVRRWRVRLDTRIKSSRSAQFYRSMNISAVCLLSHRVCFHQKYNYLRYHRKLQEWGSKLVD